MSKALRTAIEENDSEAVRKALKTVKDIHRKLPDARAPLLYACEKGADKVLEVLFEAGAIAEKRHTFPGDTPFAVAAHHRQFCVMRRLLELKQASDHAVRHVLENACIDGTPELLEFILKEIKPPITIELFRLSFVPSNASEMIKLLVKYGGDLRARHDTIEAKGMTPLHEAAGSGKAHVIRTLLECGAEANSRDELGRTPLLVLAASLEGIEIGNDHAEYLGEALRSGEAQLIGGEFPKTVDGLKALETLLELGADASLVDQSGNDAIDYCELEFGRCDMKPPTKVIEILRTAGAKGSGPTLKLFAAIRKKSVVALRAAIAEGADVNRLAPPPGGSTPLTWVSTTGAEEMVEALLNAGADPNKYDSNETPLIRAARCGHLALVKRLIVAGADIHAVGLNSEYPDNAYSAAKGNRQHEVADFLKGLGAAMPKPAKSEPLKPGVDNWNDFSELLVKTSVEEAARALARLIEGKVQLNAYGLSLTPGKRTYVVVRPRGMDWCNVFQIAPPPLRFEDSKTVTHFCVALAKSARAPVLSIEYSDTSDAASVFRVEADGKSKTDAGWDHEMVAEMVEAMSDKAPAWAKKKLARSDEDDPTSTERLEMLAERERFVVAAFGLDCEPGRKVDVEFDGYGAECFEAVAFVST